MHIVYICREYPPSLRGGGIASYIKEIAHGMVNRGHHVTVVCASDDTRIEREYEDDGVRVIRLKGGNFIIPQIEKMTLLRRWRSLYRFHSYMKRIRRTIERLKDVDVIEVPEYGSESYSLHGIEVPVVIRLHTPALFDHNTMGKVKFSLRLLPFYWQGLQELRLMREARYITSCSTSLKDWAVKNTNNKADDIKVIYNPINCAQWSQSIPKHLASKKRTILFAGTICDWKGCGDLAKTGELLHQQNPDLDFTIKFVGKKGHFAEMLANQYKDSKWFDLVGKVSREQLMTMYHEADVVCFPSWWENMPMVCIEAMLQGAVVIGSNSGGMSEIIEDGQSGFLLKPQQPQVWADKIGEVLAMSEEKREDIAIKAQERIKKTFDISAITAQMERYYEQVIKDFKS